MHDVTITLVKKSSCDVNRKELTTNTIVNNFHSDLNCFVIMVAMWTLIRQNRQICPNLLFNDLKDMYFFNLAHFGKIRAKQFICNEMKMKIFN